MLYSSGDGQAIGGLQSGQTYYAINVTSTTNSTHLQLSATKGGSAIDLTSTGTGTSHSIVRGGDTPSGDASETGPRVITPTTTSLNGVAVTASNSDDIAAVGIAAGFSGEAAVNLSGAVAVVTANTSAYIGKSAEIDSAGDVTVAAGNQYHELSIAASIAVSGGAGVGVGVGIRLLTLNTDAFIDNSAVVNAGGNVSVIATGKESIIAVVAGVGGGEVGVAGTVDVTILHVHTFASTGTNVSILAGNNVLVSAQDDSKLVLITASLAGGYVGIGVAVGVASVSKDTEAFIGAGSNVDAQAGGAPISGVYDGNFTGSGGFETTSFDGLAVQSASSEDVFGLAASIGGGFVGVAGGVGVTLLHVTTQAFVGNGAIADSDGGSVNVAAVDSFKSFTVAGGAGGGFVGVAGGVDIGVADSSVAAYLGAGTSVNAAGDVGVFGLSTKDVRTYALSIGVGFVGAAGSVSVWTIGTQPVTTYNDAAGGPDRGTWSSTVANDPNNFYKKGDVVTFNGSKYAAKTDHPLDDPSHASEWEGNTDALPNNGSTAQGSADQAASGSDESGGPGYKSILNGASASSSGPAPAWISGHAYAKDDKVTFGGQTRTRRAHAVTSRGRPGARPDELAAEQLVRREDERPRRQRADEPEVDDHERGADRQRRQRRPRIGRSGRHLGLDPGQRRRRPRRPRPREGQPHRQRHRRLDRRRLRRRRRRDPDHERRQRDGGKHRRRLEHHRRRGRLRRRHRRGVDERGRLRSRLRRHRRRRRGRRAGDRPQRHRHARTRTSTTARRSTRPAAASS